MAKIADISNIPVPSKETGQRSIPISEAYFARFVPSWSQPSQLTPEQWRYWVKMQPIAVACKDTMISNISDLDWKITPRESDQRDELKGNICHYEKLLQQGGGSLDWVNLLELTINDLLDLPFGSAWEVGRKNNDPEGRVIWLKFMDGGTCYPTNNDNYPVYQYYNGYDATLPYYGVARTYMNPRNEIEKSGWGTAPPERIFLAMEMLARGDKYYANLLLDIPPAGVFDLGDITWEDANTWIQSFRTAVTGVGSADSFKIPVLAEHTGKVEFIPLGKPPGEIMYDRITLKYASLVCAGYGMNLGDIGVASASSSGETLAGSIRGEQKTNRTGKARVKAKIKYFIESFLPDTLQFDFIDTDGERLSMLGRARLANATAMNQYREMEAISPQEARLQAIQDGLFTISMPEEPPAEAKKPVPTPFGAPGKPGQKKPPERPGSVGSPQPPSLGGDGEVKKSIEFVTHESEMNKLVERIVTILAPNVKDSLRVREDEYEPVKSLLLETLLEGDSKEQFSDAMGTIVKSVNFGKFITDNAMLAEELRGVFAYEGFSVVNAEAYANTLRERCQQDFPAFLGKAISYILINSDKLFSEDLLPSVKAEVNKGMYEYVSAFLGAQIEKLLSEVEEETPSFLTPKTVIRKSSNPITVEGANITMPDIHVTVPERSVQLSSQPVNVYPPDVTVNVPEQNVTVNVPQQDAPVVNLSIPETQVNITTPDVTVNVPKQPTPNVTVTNEVQSPTVENSITVNPTPITNEVHVPKIEKTTQKVYRDINLNIDGTITDYEYKE